MTGHPYLPSRRGGTSYRKQCHVALEYVLFLHKYLICKNWNVPEETRCLAQKMLRVVSSTSFAFAVVVPVAHGHEGKASGGGEGEADVKKVRIYMSLNVSRSMGVVP